MMILYDGEQYYPTTITITAPIVTRRSKILLQMRWGRDIVLCSATLSRVREKKNTRVDVGTTTKSILEKNGIVLLFSAYIRVC